jgi:carbon storage regulator
MLVLTRKSEESVIVGSNIEIKVLGIWGDQVKLGFVAPGTVSIYRKEVYETIQKENLLAVKSGREGVESLLNEIGSHMKGTTKSTDAKQREG